MLSCEQQSPAFKNLFQEVGHAELGGRSCSLSRPRRSIRSPTLFEPIDEATGPKPPRPRRTSSTPKMSKRQKNTKRRGSSSKAEETTTSQAATTPSDAASLQYNAENYKILFELSENLVFQSLERSEFARVEDSDLIFLRDLRMATGNGALNFLNSQLPPPGDTADGAWRDCSKRPAGCTSSDDAEAQSTKRLCTDGDRQESGSQLEVDLDELEELSAVCRYFQHQAPADLASSEKASIAQLRSVVQQLWYDPFEELFVETLIRERCLMQRTNCKESLNDEIAKLEEQADQLDAAALIALENLTRPVAHDSVLLPLRAELEGLERCIGVLSGKARPTTPYRIRERHRPSITAIERAESAPSYVRKRYRGSSSPTYQLPSTETGTLVDAFRPQLGLWMPAIILGVRDRTSCFKDVKVLYCHMGIRPLLARIRKHGLQYPVVQQAMSDLTNDCRWVHCTEQLVAPMGRHLSAEVFQAFCTADEISAGVLDFQR